MERYLYVGVYGISLLSFYAGHIALGGVVWEKKGPGDYRRSHDNRSLVLRGMDVETFAEALGYLMRLTGST